jgi:transposase
MVTHVAMESTGVYWKPVWNILEGHFTLVLANAQHVKNVPGRKTDTKDSEWLAELLQHGLLAGSFVPPRLIRDLRDLTRTRATLTQESSRIASRIQKVLEDASIKLASVASDALGKSGQASDRSDWPQSTRHRLLPAKETTLVSGSRGARF